MPKSKSVTKIRSYRYTSQYYRTKKTFSHSTKNENESCSTEALQENPKTAPAPKNQSESILHVNEPAVDQPEDQPFESDSPLASPTDKILNSDSNFDSDDSSDHSAEEKVTFMTGFREWALSHNITHSALNDLLTLERAHGRDHLPKDSRTLLRTPLSSDIVVMGTGKFLYMGVSFSLVNALTNIKECPSRISLIINIDGMSPFNSSNHQFWPICILIDELRYIKPMVVAIYYGDSKPPLELFLHRFVTELNEILASKLNVHKKEIEVKIKCFVCDTQARSFLLGTPACNAEYGSCNKCTVEGEWDSKGRHMSYPQIDCPSRTDLSFRNKTDEDHHKCTTPLIDLPINMVEDFVVADPLHLFDLGIMRRCLYGWRDGSYNFRTKMSKAQIEQMSEMLEECNQLKPFELIRAIRTLKSLKFWKGSEYHVFLLYIGVVVLKDVISTEVYDHFLWLTCAYTIFSSSYYTKFLDVGKLLISEYIEMFKKIYGLDSISSNVHNLSHVYDDVKKFGPLPTISSAPFEDCLGHLKPLVRHGNLPLSQVGKRLHEVSMLNIEKSKDDSTVLLKYKIREEHEDTQCKGSYKHLQIKKDFNLRVDNKNNYILTKSNEVIIISNFTYFNNIPHLYGKKITSTYDFFLRPFKSSKLNIFAAKISDCQHKKLYSLCDVKCKLFKLKYNEEFIFIPIITTLDRF